MLIGVSHRCFHAHSHVTAIVIKTKNCKLDRTKETLRGNRIKLSASEIQFLDSSDGAHYLSGGCCFIPNNSLYEPGLSVCDVLDV